MYFNPLTTPITIIEKTPSSGVNIAQAAITAFFAVISGFILYIIKSYIDETRIRQKRELNKLKADISYTLIMYANVYTNPLNKATRLSEEAGNALRDCAARLGSFLEEWPQLYKGAPNKEEIKSAYKELILLSNSVTCHSVEDGFDKAERNDNARNKIKVLLKLNDI